VADHAQNAATPRRARRDPLRAGACGTTSSTVVTDVRAGRVPRRLSAAGVRAVTIVETAGDVVRPRSDAAGSRQACPCRVVSGRPGERHGMAVLQGFATGHLRRLAPAVRLASPAGVSATQSTTTVLT
jgi:hypothetical protein